MNSTPDRPETINTRRGYHLCIYCGEIEQRNDGIISCGSCEDCKDRTMVISTKSKCPCCGKERL